MTTDLILRVDVTTTTMSMRAKIYNMQARDTRLCSKKLYRYSYDDRIHFPVKLSGWTVYLLPSVSGTRTYMVFESPKGSST